MAKRAKTMAVKRRSTKGTLSNGRAPVAPQHLTSGLELAITTSHDRLASAINLIDEQRVILMIGDRDCTADVRAILLKAEQSCITQNIAAVLGSEKARSLISQVTSRPGRNGQEQDCTLMQRLLSDDGEESILALARL